MSRSRKKFKKAATSSTDQRERVSREQGKSKPEHDQRVDTGLKAAQVDAVRKKREQSNIRRLKAIQKREERVGRPHLYIHLDGPSAAQHIVFSSSDEEASKKERSSAHVSTLSVEGAGDHGGSKGAMRRVLFDSDDSEDLDDPELFAVRRQFEGKRGEKLFKLQQRIGVDSRFRLDERFVESGEEEEEEENGADMHDELAEQLQQEKSKALSIIDSILGSTSYVRWNSSSHKRAGNDPSAIFPARYDPESSNCAELEQPSTTEQSPHSERESMDDGEEEEEQEEDISAPMVSGERYFCVSGDLKNTFSGQGFSFLGEEGSRQQSDCEQQQLCVSEHKDLDTSGKKKKLKSLKRTEVQPEFSLARPPSPVSADAGLTSETVEDKSKIVSKPLNLFFFHSNNETLVNRLDENTFYRTVSLGELERGWGNRRLAMKQSARKQHRDAVRMAHKKRKL